MSDSRASAPAGGQERSAGGQERSAGGGARDRLAGGASAQSSGPSRSRKLLVTGGAGYVGSVVAAHLLAAGHRVTVLDDLSTGFRAAVPEGAHFVHGRVQDAASVLDASYDAVLHFAAFSQVGESVADPEKYWRNNVVGTLDLLAAMRVAGVRTLVFSSTAATYGEGAGAPLAETAPTVPTSPYGATKLAVDHMIRAECAAHGLSAVSLRYFNVAGAHGAQGERHDPESHLIPLVLQVALGRRAEIAVFGDDYPTPDGTCVRDYIHVADLAEAHLLALDHAMAGGHLVCNLGNGNGFSVREVIETARAVTGRPIPAVTRPRRPGDPAVLVAAADRAREVLGWTPRRSDLAEIIRDAWTFATATAGVAAAATAGVTGAVGDAAPRPRSNPEPDLEAESTTTAGTTADPAPGPASAPGPTSTPTPAPAPAPVSPPVPDPAPVSVPAPTSDPASGGPR